MEGKRAAKEALQQRLGLRKSDYPLVGIITRLTVQKGIHLIKHAIFQTLDKNGQVKFHLIFLSSIIFLVFNDQESTGWHQSLPSLRKSLMFHCRLSCWVQLQILEYRVILLIWPISCIPPMGIVLASV